MSVQPVKTSDSRTLSRGGRSSTNQSSAQVQTTNRGARSSTQTTPANTVTDTESQNTQASTVLTEDAGGTISFRVRLKGGLFNSASNPPVCPT